MAGNRIALALLSSVWLAPSLAEPLLPKEQVATSSASKANEREVWWSTEWARLLQLDGSWEVVTGGDFVRLRPEDPSCSVSVLARSTGDVHEYEMGADGELAFGFGWIMISREKSLLLSERVAGEDQPVPVDITAASKIMLTGEFLEKLVFRGHEGWRVGDYLSNERRFTIWRHCAPGATDTGFEIHDRTGRVQARPRERADPYHIFLFQARGESGQLAEECISFGEWNAR